MFLLTVVAWLVVRWWWPLVLGAECLALGLTVGWLVRPLTFRPAERNRRRARNV